MDDTIGLFSAILVWVWLTMLSVAMCVLGWMYMRKESSLRMETRTYNLPPGDISPWAIWGDTLEMIFSWYPVGTPPPFLVKKLQRYGPIFKTRLLGLRTIVCLDAEVSRQLILSEGHQGLVHGAMLSTLRRLVGPNSLPCTHGSHFKRMRSPVALHLSATKLSENAHLLSRLQRFTLSTLSSWKYHKPYVLVQDEAYKFTFSIAIMTILGLEPNDNDTCMLANCFKSFVPAITSKFPLNVPGTTYAKALKGRKLATMIIKRLIQKRREAILSLNGDFHMKDSNKDLINLMMMDTNREDGAPSYNDEELVDVIFGLIMAGRETVSVILFMAIKYLTDNPKALLELREEHESIRHGALMREQLSKTIMLDIEDFAKMEFTQKVITETLRLTNVSPFVQRVAIQDIEIEGFTIPKGWNIFLSPTVTHLTAKFHEDPLQFNPWRWKESTNLTKSFSPFGLGLRFCVGVQIARLEIAMFLHYLVTLYRWEIAIKDDAFCTPVVKMLKGFPIHVIPSN